MPASSTEPVDLLDLKLLPAWVKEPAETKSYAHYQGDEGEERRPRGRGRDFREKEGGRKRRTPDGPSRTGNRPASKADSGDRRRPQKGAGRDHRPRKDTGRQDRYQPAPAIRKAPDVAVRFVPHPPAFESVAKQIKEGTVAYSLFALARLFLEKPERYNVHLTAKPESPLFQLGENGAIAADRPFLENSAFRFAKEDFYRIDITQSEPIKGNFTSVARDRLSGTLLGPTNHHAYQPRLRTLYEQRFSGRMSFPEYQRQIEIVSDPALVEQWKEEARTVTTFTTVKEETALTFASAVEAEKNFRQTYLPDLVKAVAEVTIGGVMSRSLPDRVLGRVIEDRWSMETRSPSQMMPELASQLRDAGLHIFRHRRGMLFVSPIRPRPFAHEQTSVSPHVTAILETVGANQRINRKDLAGKILVHLASDEVESRKLALASDLHWLVSEGYVIEFNDGSLDLPRSKAKPPEIAKEKPEVVAAIVEETVVAAVPAAEPKEETSGD
jgi:hypothetical protein